MADLLTLTQLSGTPEQDSPDPTVAQARSQLIELQALVTVVLSYQLLFSPEALLSVDALRVAILLLMLTCGSLIVLPDAMIGASWFAASLALIDTTATTVLLYLSGNGSSEVYLTYFIILLIATTARTRRQLVSFVALVCALYAVVLYREYLHSGVVLEQHLIRFPLFMIMGVFYGGTMERVRTLSEFDPLTGLPNRRLFIHILNEGLRRTMRQNRSAALLSMDLDGFKLVNDTLGHKVGDRLIKAVCDRLRNVLPATACLARWGGDEFYVFLEDIASTDDATGLAQRLLTAMAEPFAINDRDMFMTATIGIALCPIDSQDSSGLVKNADAAMHRAKELGKNAYELYAADINARASERLLVSSTLRKALDRNQLLVYYQPQVDLKTGRIGGLEALIRWQHPELGLVLPVRFILVAEDTGLIVSIGEWVLRTACAQVQAWRQRGHPDLRATVNLSARQLKQASVVRMVRQALGDTGLPPERLELELTEGSIVQDVDLATQRLKELKAIGVRISIDDFGSGYSALSYLKRFPMDTLKIDQTLVRDITTSQDARAIVNAVIAMGRVLKVHIVAEGVENEGQLQCLREEGCDECQGFLFSKAVPTWQIEGLLQRSDFLSRHQV